MVTPVAVGPSDETHTLIKAGLAEGDQVISGPFKVLDTLAHDQKVKKQDAPGAATQPTTQPTSGPATQPTTEPAPRPGTQPVAVPATGPA